MRPSIAPYPYDKVNFGAITQPPSPQHWLGTDSLGRDVLSRLMYGARVSFSVSIVAQVVILLIGVPIGLISGILWRLAGYIHSARGGYPVCLSQSAVYHCHCDVPQSGAEIRLRSGDLEGSNTINQATGGLMGVFIALALVFWLTVARLVRGEVFR